MPAENYVQLLDSRKAEIEKLLPDYLDLDKFLWNARQIARDSNLRNCSAEALFNCALDAARRGMEIGGPNKHCYIVPFGNLPVLIPSWQGRSFLWQRSGAIVALRARVVYTWDEFSFDAGENTLSHKPDIRHLGSSAELNDIANIVGAYAIATLWSRERAISFVSRIQIIRLMEWLKKKNNGQLGFGWRDWLPEMCCKTAVHRLEGFVQPPPDMTPEQIDAWHRASQAESTAFDAEAEGTPTEPNIDLPGERDKDDPNSSGDPDRPGLVSRSHGVRPSEANGSDGGTGADTGDRTLTIEETNSIFDLADACGLVGKELSDLLKKRVGTVDPAEVKISQFGLLKTAIQAAKR